MKSFLDKKSASSCASNRMFALLQSVKNGLIESDGMKKAIVIPSYRAEKSLASVLSRIPKEFWQEGVAIIVNDKSPDKTGEVAESLKAQWPALHVVHHELNRGYGGAQKTGLKRGLELGADAFAIVHSDGQYAPEVVLDLMKPILEGKAHIVQGSRMADGGALRGGMPYSRYVPNRVLTFMENIVFGTRMAEFHSGYMLYSRTLLERAPFEELAEQLQLRRGNDCSGAPLGHGVRADRHPHTRYDDEVSSLDPIPYGINVLKMMARHLRGDYRKLLRRNGQSVQPSFGSASKKNG